MGRSWANSVGSTPATASSVGSGRIAAKPAQLTVACEAASHFFTGSVPVLPAPFYPTGHARLRLRLGLRRSVRMSPSDRERLPLEQQKAHVSRVRLWLLSIRPTTPLAFIDSRWNASATRQTFPRFRTLVCGFILNGKSDLTCSRLFQWR
jgi:hypothetical protein